MNESFLRVLPPARDGRGRRGNKRVANRARERDGYCTRMSTYKHLKTSLRFIMNPPRSSHISKVFRKNNLGRRKG